MLPFWARGTYAVHMTYEQALAYVYDRVNFEKTLPRPDDLRLERMRALLRALGDPHDGLRVVHVAGSKGKGSTSAMLAAILRRAGLRTGLFTSPHLCRFEERIQVDGVPVGPSELVQLADAVADAERRAKLSPGQAPTFFEVATALGFLHFARRRVDVAVIEVGLGGRFDSTNVCRPLVAVVTSISHDHTQQLGPRLQDISREKAGIIKPGCRCISGVRAREPREVIERTCRQRSVPLRQLGIDFHYRYWPGWYGPEIRRPAVEIRTDRGAWPVTALGLLGEHQAANAAVALGCVEDLNDVGLNVSAEAAALGLAEVEWPARLEVFGRGPQVVLDCAHNVASAQALVDTLSASFPPGRRVLVFAASGDKDIAGMFAVLGPMFAHAFVTRYQSPRSADADGLARVAWETGRLAATPCPSPSAAYRAARAAAGPGELVCVTGSVFLAGELRPLVLADTAG